MGPAEDEKIADGEQERSGGDDGPSPAAHAELAEDADGEQRADGEHAEAAATGAVDALKGGEGIEQGEQQKEHADAGNAGQQQPLRSGNARAVGVFRCARGGFSGVRAIRSPEVREAAAPERVGSAGVLSCMVVAFPSAAEAAWLEGVEIGEELLHLLVVDAVAKGGHEAVAVEDCVGDTLVSGGGAEWSEGFLKMATRLGPFLPWSTRS